MRIGKLAAWVVSRRALLLMSQSKIAINLAKCESVECSLKLERVRKLQRSRRKGWRTETLLFAKIRLPVHNLRSNLNSTNFSIIIWTVYLCSLPHCLNQKSRKTPETHLQYSPIMISQSGANGSAKKNQKWKFPFFFHNLNTLSSVSLQNATLHFVSISHLITFDTFVERHKKWVRHENGNIKKKWHHERRTSAINHLLIHFDCERCDAFW